MRNVVVVLLEIIETGAMESPEGLSYACNLRIIDGNVYFIRLTVNCVRMSLLFIALSCILSVTDLLWITIGVLFNGT